MISRLTAFALFFVSLSFIIIILLMVCAFLLLFMSLSFIPNPISDFCFLFAVVFKCLPHVIYVVVEVDPERNSKAKLFILLCFTIPKFLSL